MTIVDAATAALLLASAFFFGAGTLGVLRFPDALARLHAITKADNLGLGLLVAGLALQAESLAAAGKLVLIWIAALLASATTAYLIGGAAIQGPQDVEADD